MDHNQPRYFLKKSKGYVGWFFQEETTHSWTTGGSVQRWYRVSMYLKCTQKCTACPLCMDQKVYGSDSETSVLSAQEVL